MAYKVFGRTLRKPTWVLFAFLMLGSYPAQAIEENDSFLKVPHIIKKYILELAALEMGKDKENADKLALVSKNWNKILKEDNEKNKGKIKKAWCHGYYDIKTQQEKKIFENFYNSKLVYEPDPNSNQERIELPIATLANPLKGTFDLSKCGDRGKYLSISTGYARTKKVPNLNEAESTQKVMIWVAPPFLVERELNPTSNTLQDCEIVPGEWMRTAAVSIFWAQEGNDATGLHDYFTVQDMEKLKNDNLFELYRKAMIKHYERGWRPQMMFGVGVCRHFKLVCELNESDR